MKKAILLLTVMIIASLSITANAQIKVQKTFTNDLIIIGNITGGSAVNIIGAIGGNPNHTHAAEHRLYCRIFDGKTTFGILVNTENRFDDDFEFALGTDIEKAKESINTIIEFMQTNPLKTSITVKDEDDRTIQLNLKRRNTITLKAIDAQGAIICNEILLTQANLERALKLLNNKAERKIKEAIANNNM